MSTRVYELTEIMLHILKLSTVESIVTVGHANRLGQVYAREVIDGFIQAMLKPYFPVRGKPQTY